MAKPFTVSSPCPTNSRSQTFLFPRTKSKAIRLCRQIMTKLKFQQSMLLKICSEEADSHLITKTHSFHPPTSLSVPSRKAKRATRAQRDYPQVARKSAPVSNSTLSGGTICQPLILTLEINPRSPSRWGHKKVRSKAAPVRCEEHRKCVEAAPYRREPKRR